MEQKQALLLSDYNYDLPEELIAQDPSEKRDESRLFFFFFAEKGA